MHAIEIAKTYIQAAQTGDQATLGRVISPDVVWHQPGHNQFSGTHRGMAAVGQMLGQMMAVSKGTFAITRADHYMANGDWVAVGIVFTSTLAGFSARQQLTKAGVNHFIIFILSAFVASLCASSALRFDCTAETAIATSVLFLVPGVPLINGVIDIVEGHVLNGIARLASALMLIICIAIGLSCTLMIVKNGLL